MFGTTRGSLNDGDIRLAQGLADVAAVAIVQHRLLVDGHLVNQQLQTALDSRIVLEQAKGIIAQVGGVDMTEAFRLLRRYSRDHNAAIREVAADVVSRRLTAHDLLGARSSDAEWPERMSDERERMADERERLADERERLADEREARASARDEEIAGILRRAEQRDQAAAGRSRRARERDQAADVRDRHGPEDHPSVAGAARQAADAASDRAAAAVDRIWEGMDSDAAAADRARLAAGPTQEVLNHERDHRATEGLARGIGQANRVQANAEHEDESVNSVHMGNSPSGSPAAAPSDGAGVDS